VSESEPTPDFATVIDWVEGRLDPTAAARVADAAARDPRVGEIVAWLHGFHAAAAALPLVDAPPIVGQRLRQHFDRWATAGGEPRGEPVEVVARMLFDSRQDAALDDRDAGTTDGREDDAEIIAHLAFTSEPADVVLDVQRLGPGRVRIAGQVLAADGVGRAYVVEATGPRMTAVRSVAGDQEGRFRLAELPDRVDRLRLDSGELVLLLQFDVGWSRP
jgi:hypothetical protein